MKLIEREHSCVSGVHMWAPTGVLSLSLSLSREEKHYYQGRGSSNLQCLWEPGRCRRWERHEAYKVPRVSGNFGERELQISLPCCDVSLVLPDLSVTWGISPFSKNAQISNLDIKHVKGHQQVSWDLALQPKSHLSLSDASS